MSADDSRTFRSFSNRAEYLLIGSSSVEYLLQQLKRRQKKKKEEKNKKDKKEIKEGEENKKEEKEEEKEEDGDDTLGGASINLLDLRTS